MISLKINFILIIFLVLFLTPNIFSKEFSVGAIILNGAPLKPELIEINDLYGINNIAFSWSSFDYEHDSIKYFLQVGSFLGSKDILDINLDENYYNITLDLGKQYFYRVKACDNYYGDYNNCSDWGYDSFYLLTFIIIPPSGGGGGGSSSSQVIIYGCKELEGIICNSNELCYDNLIATYDTQSCCFSKCILKDDLGKVVDSNIAQIDLELSSPINEIIAVYPLDGVINLFQKRFLTDSEITIKKTMRIYNIINVYGMPEYRVFIFITIKNISKDKLTNLEILTLVPNSFVNDLYEVNSNNIFIRVVDKNMLKFDKDFLDSGESYNIDYYFDTSKEFIVLENLFKGLSAPLVLTKMDDSDNCAGIFCNDFNPCTTDFCHDGFCKFINNNLNCENGRCIGGKCVLVIPEKKSLINWKIYLVIGVILFIIIIFVLLIYFLRKPKNKEHWFLQSNIRDFI